MDYLKNHEVMVIHSIYEKHQKKEPLTIYYKI